MDLLDSFKKIVSPKPVSNLAESSGSLPWTSKKRTID